MPSARRQKTKAKPAVRRSKPAPPKAAAKPAPKKAAHPPAKKTAPAPTAAKSPAKSGPTAPAPIVRRPDGRLHVLSLSFVRDGDEFLARMETDGGQITELKNRALDQLLTLVASELEDLLE